MKISYTFWSLFWRKLVKWPKKDLLHFELLFTNAWDLQDASVKFDIKLSSTTYKNPKITLKPLIWSYFDSATSTKYIGVFVTAWRTKVVGQKNILRPVELGSLCLSVMIPLGVTNAWCKKLCRLCSFAEAPWYSFCHGVTEILGVDSKIPRWAPIMVKLNFFFLLCLWETYIS